MSSFCLFLQNIYIGVSLCYFMGFENKYDSKVKEGEIRNFWEKEGIFKFDKDTSKEVYSIDTPPPTVSGKMHMGHAFSFSQQDFIARYKRMSGFEVYYPFGTDDNGLATEKLVQKEKKVNLRQKSREEAVKIVLEYLAEQRPKFIDDWKNIGMSCDFSLVYSTIDDYSRKISQKSFLEMANKKLAYRKEAPVIWDTVFQTAIAQAELEDVEKETFFNDIVFKLKDGGEDLIIATTRPELLGACVAVFAHPDDKKYQHLFGKIAISPLYNVEVPILPDEGADPEKGTGLVMCCTFGDQKDIEWYKKHNLPLKMVITKDGKMNEKAGKYEGLKIEEARKTIIEDLREAKLLVNQKKIVHAVNVGERSGMPVEIINSKQWYIQYLDRKDDFLSNGERLNWHPFHMKHRLDNWIKGLNWDWSISRQRHFGVPIPVWYCKGCGEIKYADETQLPVDPISEKPISVCSKCKGNEFVGEEDVFDTWFTSASTPFLAINMMEGEAVYKKLFPMSLRPQAHDIINFWLFYTMAKTNILHGVNPWADVTISGFILDPKGNKMSKSKGNVIAPQDMIDKYSGDAIRFAAGGTKLGSDIPFQEKDLQTGIKVANKLYNANKFASMLLKDFTAGDRSFKLDELNSIDKWVVAKAQQVFKESVESMDKYEYSKARANFELYFMRDIADNYIEIVKDRLWKPEERGVGEARKAQKALYYGLYNSLKGLAPFMVYITEEIYQAFYREFEEGKSIHRQNYPKYLKEFDDAKIVELGDKFVSIVGAVRKFKSEKQLSMKVELEKFVIECDKDLKEFIEDSIDDLKAVTGAKAIEFGKGDIETDAQGVRVLIRIGE